MPRIRDRLIGDFLMASRLELYRRILETALEAGYEIQSVGSAWAALRRPDDPPGHRRLILRHDVDTDPATAAAMLDIDRSLGIRSSYFFRLSTLAPDTMAKVADMGGEASYHFEELATIAKRRALRTKADVMRYLPEARDLFAENIAALRHATGLPMDVVASHGDFVNVRLGAPNWLILTDPAFRRQSGVILETYDRDYIAALPCRITDRAYPVYWDPQSPTNAIRDGNPSISLLVHPRHWRTDWLGNARDDLRRLAEGAAYRLGVPAPTLWRSGVG